MARKDLILGRYEVIGEAGSGGFGTVSVAWDPRIQRKVAIKTIPLSEYEVARASLPGADARDGSDAAEEPATPQRPVRRHRALSPSEVRSQGLPENDPDSDDLDPEVLDVDEEVEVESEPFSDEPEEVLPWDEEDEVPTDTDVEDEEGDDPLDPDDDATVAMSPIAGGGSSRHAEPTGNSLRLAGLPSIELDSQQGATTNGSHGRHSLRDLPTPAATTPETTAALKPIPDEETTGPLEPLDDDLTRPMAPLDDDRTRPMAPVEEVPDDEFDPEAELDEGYEPEIDAAMEGFDGEDLEDPASHEEPFEPEDDLEPEADVQSDGPDAWVRDTQRWDHPAEALAGNGTADLRAARPVTESLTKPKRSSDAAPITTLAHLPGLDEARTAAKLSDSRIVSVYDFEIKDSTAYLIMEYIEGITLTELLESYGDLLTLDTVAGVFDAVSGALEVAHENGVLHLDIKPDNIMINKNGQAKVMDFGLATLADASGVGTTGGGTIGYMPLEQMHRGHLDARTDEWSLAAVAYEMLTGTNPFLAPSLKDAERAITDAELVLPSLCWDDADEQLDDVIFYGLDPEPDERYDSVSDFAEEVEKFLGDPEQGQRELALIVKDALDGDASIEDVMPEEPQDGRHTLMGLFGWRGKGDDDRRSRQDRADDEDSPRGRAGVGQRLRDMRAAYGEVDDLEDAAEDAQPKLRERKPLAYRIPDKVLAIAARVFSAAGSGFIGALALSNMPFLSSWMSSGAYLLPGIGALVFAALAAVVPAIGAVGSFFALSIAILACGHPIVGVVLAVASLLWWYIIAREGPADTNVGLLGPLAGGFGLGAAVPFISGSTLRPVEAGVSMGFWVIVATIMASLGSGTMLGWDALANWSFAEADITRNLSLLLTQPLTLTTAIGWIAGAVGLSIFSLSNKRWGLFLGLAIAAAAVLAGTLVFTIPSPQLMLSVIAGVIAVIAAFY